MHHQRCDTVPLPERFSLPSVRRIRARHTGDAEDDAVPLKTWNSPEQTVTALTDAFARVPTDGARSASVGDLSIFKNVEDSLALEPLGPSSFAPAGLRHTPLVLSPTGLGVTTLAPGNGSNGHASAAGLEVLGVTALDASATATSTMTGSAMTGSAMTGSALVGAALAGSAVVSAAMAEAGFRDSLTMRLRSADRVLVQVGSDGRRRIQHLPPRRRDESLTPTTTRVNSADPTLSRADTLLLDESSTIQSDLTRGHDNHRYDYSRHTEAQPLDEEGPREAGDLADGSHSDGRRVKNLMRENLMRENLMRENLMRENLMHENLMHENRHVEEVRLEASRSDLHRLERGGDEKPREKEPGRRERRKKTGGHRQLEVTRSAPTVLRPETRKSGLSVKHPETLSAVTPRSQSPAPGDESMRGEAHSSRAHRKLRRPRKMPREGTIHADEGGEATRIGAAGSAHSGGASPLPSNVELTPVRGRRHRQPPDEEFLMTRAHGVASVIDAAKPAPPITALVPVPSPLVPAHALLTRLRSSDLSRHPQWMPLKETRLQDLRPVEVVMMPATATVPSTQVTRLQALASHTSEPARSHFISRRNHTEVHTMPNLHSPLQPRPIFSPTTPPPRFASLPSVAMQAVAKSASTSGQHAHGNSPTSASRKAPANLAINTAMNLSGSTLGMKSPGGIAGAAAAHSSANLAPSSHSQSGFSGQHGRSSQHSPISQHALQPRHAPSPHHNYRGAAHPPSGSTPSLTSAAVNHSAAGSMGVTTIHANPATAQPSILGSSNMTSSNMTSSNMTPSKMASSNMTSSTIAPSNTTISGLTKSSPTSASTMSPSGMAAQGRNAGMPSGLTPVGTKLAGWTPPGGTSSSMTPAETGASDASASLTPMVVLLSLEGFKAPVNGIMRRHTNQDRGFIHEVSQRFTVFAIFDGHGDRGHDVAQFVSNGFQGLLQRDFPAADSPEAEERLSQTLTSAQLLAWLQASFASVDRSLIEDSGIDCNYSGCTASVAIRHNSTIYVAYVGDSKVAGFQFRGKRPFCLVETPEHCPSAKNEMARIRSLGASVSEQRFQHFSKTISRIVEAGLSVSRAFGDLAARPYGVISDPEFVQIEIPATSSHRSGRPRKAASHFPLMLIVASDGLWDTISPYEILDFISNAQQPQNRLFDSLKQIAEVAWRRRLAAEGRSDDTTAIVALLQ